MPRRRTPDLGALHLKSQHSLAVFLFQLAGNSSHATIFKNIRSWTLFQPIFGSPWSNPCASWDWMWGNLHALLRKRNFSVLLINPKQIKFPAPYPFPVPIPTTAKAGIPEIRTTRHCHILGKSPFPWPCCTSSSARNPK